VVKVVEGRFSLEHELVNGVEHVKSECRSLAIERGRKPTSLHELCPAVDDTIGTAVAEVN